jgi:hypothetical protein
VCYFVELHYIVSFLLLSINVYYTLVSLFCQANSGTVFLERRNCPKPFHTVSLRTTLYLEMPGLTSCLALLFIRYNTLLVRISVCLCTVKRFDTSSNDFVHVSSFFIFTKVKYFINTSGNNCLSWFA